MAGLDDLGMDINDPLGSLYEENRRRGPAEFRRPLPPEEAQSYGQRLLGAGAGGLSHLLGVLNKPGRALRGLASGKPNEALAILPFSDTRGITNPEDEVTGAQINQNLFGLKNDNSWKSWVAGLATDIATDPLTYMTFGAKHALTAAGKTAQKAGTLKPLTRQQSIAQGLGGLASVNVPGVGQKVLGQGRAAQAVAGGIDRSIDAAVYGNPVGRTLVSNLYYPAHRALSKITQKAMVNHGTPAEDLAMAATRGHQYDAASMANKVLANNPGFDEKQVRDAIRMHAEGVERSHILPIPDDVWNAAAPIGKDWSQQGKNILAESQNLGLKLSDVADTEAQYAFRMASKSALQGKNIQQKGGQLFNTKTGSNLHRKEPLRDLPGGTTMINRWSADPALTGPAATSIAPLRIFKDIYQHLDAVGRPIEPAAIPDWGGKAEQVAKILKAHPQSYTPENPLFSGRVDEATRVRGDRHARSVRNAQAIYGAIPEIAAGEAKSADNISLPAFLRAVGLRNTLDENGHLAQGSYLQALDRLGVPSAPFVGQPAKQAGQALKRFRVSKDTAREFLRDLEPWGNPPTETTGPLGVFDSLTNSFRNLAYAIWPASQVRNLTSGVVQTATRPNSGGLFGTVRNLYRQNKIMRNSATPDQVRAWTGLTRDEVLRRQFSDAAIHEGAGTAAAELSGRPANVTPRGSLVSGPTPGEGFAGKTGTTLGDAAMLYAQGATGTARRVADRLTGKLQRPIFEQQGVTPAIAQALSPVLPGMKKLAVRGEQDFPWLAAGRTAGYNVESLLRGGQWLGLHGQGMSPQSIADEIWKTQFAYDRLTPFEKNVSRRLVPFYTFTSRNLPLQAENLLTNPGRVLPQLRIAGQRTPGQHVPQHLASGVAIPVGQEDPETGSQKFVSQLGLPIEEAAERFKGTANDTALAFAGTMNPLIKGPLEWLFDKQFYSGRKLSDLRPQGPIKQTIGNFLGDDATNLAAQIVSNTPLTRVANALDKITDPRKTLAEKALNLATGVRITDVDMEKIRAIETRNALEELLRRNPQVSQYTNFYVRPENQQGLTPDAVEQLRMLRLLQSNAQKHAKDQRLKRVAIGPG